MRRFLWILAIAGSVVGGLMFLSDPGNGAPRPAGSAQAECDCSHLKVLQIELRNAMRLQQAFRNKIAELRTMNGDTAQGALKAFAQGAPRPRTDTQLQRSQRVLICSLEKPFTVTGTSPLNSYPFKFVPTSATTGTASFGATAPGISMEGSGSYKIEGADTDKPRIAMTLGSVGHTPVGSRSGGGTVYIDLVPLESGECQVSQPRQSVEPVWSLSLRSTDSPPTVASTYDNQHL